MKRIKHLYVRLVLYLLAGAGTSVSAQTQTVLEGLVTERSSGKPAGAYVLARPPGSANLAVGYAATREDGSYRLSFTSSLDSIDLCVNGMGIESAVRRIPNRNARYDFKVAEKVFQLREVKIQAEKIRMKGPDTIVYHVEAFRTEDDRVIEDVLKKLPGIQVQSNGQILYKGQPVNFTIEGMDLLKGRYGIATKNIEPRHIATVEILENHQTIKALEGLMPSDQTTLNLKLKESSKGVFLASLAAGGGYDRKGLYEAEGAGMLFARKSQHILTAKANNSGHDLRYELTDHNGGGTRTLNPTLSNAALASPPNIDRKYYYFNQSEAVSFNHLFKTGKELIVNTNALYFHDKENRQNQAVTRWMLPDSSLNTISEVVDNTISLHRIEADVSLKKNTRKFYLSNTNRFAGDFNDIAAAVNGLEQSYRLQSFRASSSLYLFKRTDDRSGFDMNLRLDYEHKPYALQIDSASGIAQENPYAGAAQRVVSDGFSAYMYTSFFKKLRLGGMTIAPVVSGNYFLNRLESLLDIPGREAENGFTNSLLLHRFYVAPSLQARHTSARWNILLNLPLSYRLTALYNRSKADIERHKVFIEPSLQVKYTASASVELSFHYGLNYSLPGVERLYEGAILTNYRSLSRYRADLSEGINHAFSFKTNYKNIFNMFFIDFHTGYSLSSPRILYGIDFDGIYSTTITQNTRRLSHNVYGKVDLSKSFYWKETMLKFSFAANYSQMPFLLQEKVATGYGQAYQASLNFSFYPFKYLLFSYHGTVLYTLSRQDRGEDLLPLWTNSNRLALSFRLPKNIHINIGGEHYYNGASTQHPSFVLFDAGIEYTYKRFRWAFQCNNLLDVRRYVYSSLAATNSFYTDYRIRPRLFLFKMFITL